jgi:hypothetical protein
MKIEGNARIEQLARELFGDRPVRLEMDAWLAAQEAQGTYWTQSAEETTETLGQEIYGMGY